MTHLWRGAHGRERIASPRMALLELDRASQYSPEVPVITGSPGLAFGSPEDDSRQVVPFATTEMQALVIAAGLR